MRSKDEYTAAFLENDPREPHLDRNMILRMSIGGKMLDEMAALDLPKRVACTVLID